MSTRGRPLIAVTSRRIDASRISNWLEPAQALSTFYLDALHRAGAVGATLVPQSPDETDAAALIGRFDGLVVAGGVDVDPALYGQSPHAETTGYDGRTDQWEIALIDAATTLGLPILAICRGCQLLNVARGGTLHQHLGDFPEVGAHGIPNGGGGTVNRLHFTSGSRVARAIGADAATGNCHHHQSVERVGDGMTVTGRTDDGIIETIEVDDPDQWIVGVQWHPEDSAMHDPLQQKLFEALVERTAT